MSKNPKYLAYLILFIFSFSLIYWGKFIGSSAFRDVDTCWLLATGQWVLEHGFLPHTDPFSSSSTSMYANTVIPGAPLYQYQWLSEVIFYGIYKLGGLAGLLILTASLSCIIYVCIPYSLLVNRAKLSPAVGLLLLLAVEKGSCYGLLVRPHIFSFLFMAILICLYCPGKIRLSKLSTIQVISILLIMLLWTNMHIFFPIGIVFLAMISFARLLEVKFIDRQDSFSYYQLLMPLIAFLPTLINPWGWRNWIYFANSLVCPYNFLNASELHPINILDFTDIATIFFDWSVLNYALLCLFYRGFSLQRLGIVSPLFAITGICMGLLRVKLVSFTFLFLLVASVEFIMRQNKDVFIPNDHPKEDASNRKEQVTKIELFLNQVDSTLKKLGSNNPLAMVTMLALTNIGSFIGMHSEAPRLPHPSDYCQPPFAAFDFLQTHTPQGAVLNDVYFGSMMIWYLKNPDVFMDTRLINDQRAVEYLYIVNCWPGYEKIWSKYNFAWVFLKPSEPIVKILRQKGWKTVYLDDLAIIMQKR